MLGLADYDSPLSNDTPARSHDTPTAPNGGPAVSNPTPSPADPTAPAASSDPPSAALSSGLNGAGSGLVTLLSYVDYFDDDKPDEPIPSAALGGSLDDEAVQKAQPRRVGGVQVSVVKTPQARAGDYSGDESAARNVTSASKDTDALPAFVLPDSPTGAVDEKLLNKFCQLVEKTREERTV